MRGIYCFVIWIIYQHQACNGDHCTQEQVLICSKNRDEHIRRLINTTDVGALLLHQMSEDVVRLFCLYYNSEIKQCYRDIRSHCNPLQQARFIGIEESTDFLCNDDFQGYIAVKRCLLKANTDKEVSICSDQFQNKKDSINKHSIEADTELCSATEEFIDCEADALRVTCGREQEAWARTYNKKKYQPELDYMKCDPPVQPDEEGIGLWVIIVIAVGGIIFVAIVILIIVCICRHISTTSPPATTTAPTIDNNRTQPQVVINQFMQQPTHDNMHRSRHQDNMHQYHLSSRSNKSYSSQNSSSHSSHKGSAVFSKDSNRSHHSKKEKSHTKDQMPPRENGKRYKKKTKKEKQPKLNLAMTTDYLVPNTYSGTPLPSYAEQPPSLSDLSGGSQDNDYTHLTTVREGNYEHLP